MRKIWPTLFLAASVLSACATVSIRFPAEAAEKAADKIIGEVWQISEARMGSCNTAADLRVDAPGVSAIVQKMRARHAQLAGYYTSGEVGLTADGMIGLHDTGVAPPASRYTMNALVAAENQDRNALYAEIANTNGHPEWQAGVRNTFAQRWVERALPGWWVQSDDYWEQK